MDQRVDRRAESSSAPDSPRQARLREQRHALAWALLVALLLLHGVLLPLSALFAPQKSGPRRQLQIELVAPAALPRVRRPSPLRARVTPKPKAKAKPLTAQQPRDTALPQQLRMVELATPATKRPPERARFLSDKNRRVPRETRARTTTLARAPKPQPTSARPPQASPPPAPARSATPRQRSALLQMRSPSDAALPPDAFGRTQPPKASPSLRLSPKALQRLFAKAVPAAPQATGKRPQRPPSRSRQKWSRIKAALENFIPEVQPGNQSALGTRADPFAVYIARMHRSIHALWGSGFLVDLNFKPDGHPLNNMRLHATMELAIAPDGSVARAVVVRGSGQLSYDVAALDTIFSAAPYPLAPRTIRSRNGNVYMHWTFYRNHRQCGTFNVHPYILTALPVGPADSRDQRPVIPVAPAPHLRRLKRLNRTLAMQPQRVTLPMELGQGAHPAPSSAGRTGLAAKRMPPAAASTLLAGFGAAFRANDAARMAALCHLPFTGRGRPIATQGKELARMFRDLLAENKGPTRLGALLSPMQARRHFGRLPAGVAYGTPTWVSQAVLGGVKAVLIVKKQNRKWGIVGLNR